MSQERRHSKAGTVTRLKNYRKLLIALSALLLVIALLLGGSGIYPADHYPADSAAIEEYIKSSSVKREQIDGTAEAFSAFLNEQP